MTILLVRSEPEQVDARALLGELSVGADRFEMRGTSPNVREGSSMHLEAWLMVGLTHAHSLVTLPESFISPTAPASLVTSTGTRQTSVLIRQVPVLSSRQ